MKGVADCLRRYRFPVRSSFLRNGNSAETLRWRLILLGGPKDVVGRVLENDKLSLSRFTQSKFFNSRYSSVHDERPSAEYAKLRKETLESQFGREVGSKSVSAFYQFGPFLALYRAAIISFHVLKLTVWRLFVHDMKKRSVKFRETLIRLGPFYVKLGQALSTRPDILPSVYCQELAKLQDQIPPFPTRVAIKSIESQLGMPISKLFADFSNKPIAAASLGQVYKAHLRSGELVAVKVQRPGMCNMLTLDALLFQLIGGQLKRFAKARKDLLVAVNEMVRHMFEEIDYILEGQNAERFAMLYGEKSCTSAEHQQTSGVKVPKIYWSLTRETVLTMEWIDGIKLTDKSRIEEARLDRKQLIDEGVYCSLRQMLEVGFFHADPHPGNLVVTKDGSLAYFDFGMMGDIPRHYRVGLIRVLVHFVNRDSLGLANDFLSLGFIPEGVEIRSVADALQASFGDDGTRQSQDFQSIMNQLYDIMYEFNFSLPPDYALVVRALGSLEGTAKALDPDFKVVESAYPFVIGRLLADPSPDMRKILGQLLIRNDGSIRWNRLEKLVAAISQQESATDGTSSKHRETSSDPLGWKSFDMHAVVAATEDLFKFILSKKGSRVRVFLIRDIILAADTFIEHEVLPCCSEEKFEAAKQESEDEAMLSRLLNGLQSVRKAVMLAPDVWAAMVIRLAVNPEFQRFAYDTVSALSAHSCDKVSCNFWLCISKVIHKLAKDPTSQNL